MTIDWAELGKAARVSADDAHEGNTPGVEIAWSFVCFNPECFTGIEFVAAYYGEVE